MDKPIFSEWIRDHVFSATELESYLRCPYRFWAQHYLKIEPENQWEIELSPIERGKILHKVLENYFRSLKDSSLSSSVLQEKVADLLETELQQTASKYPLLSPFLLGRQKEKMQRALQNFVKRFQEEKETRQALMPRHFEWSFGHTTPALEITSSDGSSIPFKGRIDRIDVDPIQKTFLIVDYKTSQTITGSQILAGHSFQLPLYVMAVQRLLLPDYQPIGAVYFNLSDLTQKDGILHAERLPDFMELHPSSSSIVPPNLWDPFFKDTEKRISDLIHEIKLENFPSEKEPCEDFCPYQDICQLRSAT